MSLRLLDVVPLGVAPVAVHDESHVSRDVSRLQHVHTHALIPGQLLLADPGHGARLRASGQQVRSGHSSTEQRTVNHDWLRKCDGFKEIN